MTDRAIWRVLADGVDFTEAAATRLLSLSVVDAAGTESDTVDLAVADPNAEIEPPRRGARLSVAMGWAGAGLVDMGIYTVDEVELSGAPTTLALTGRAADQRESLKRHRTEGHEATTLGGIARRIAARNGLEAAVAGPLDGRQVSYVAQSEESDQAFLSRLAARHGALVGVKDGRLVVAPKGRAATVSGAKMPTVIVRPGDLVEGGYTCRLKDRPAFGSVVATWSDRPGARRREVTAKGRGDGPTYTIRDPFGSEDDARAAAEARRAELERGTASLSLTLPGRPEARAEATLVVEGVRRGVDGAWRIARVTHALDAGGFTTRIEADLGNEESNA